MKKILLSSLKVSAIKLQLRTYIALVFSGFFLLSCHPTEKKETNDNPPNIIVIVADDLGWNDIGYHGSEINTPVLDKLVRGGIELDRFYVHSVCSPTRAALLTGRSPSRFGILGPLGDEAVFPKGTITIAELLKQKGYDTAISGKWHLGTVPKARPMNFGFNTTYGYLRGQIDPYTHLYKNGDKTWHRNDTLIDEEGHATDLITDEAIRFIEKPRENNNPFFIYIPYSVPHYPLQEPKKWTNDYEGKISNESRLMYAASVSHMDNAIGRVLSSLEKNGISENTIVLFFSDNGAQENWFPKTQYDGKFKANDVLGNNEPLRDWKASFYEGALRVPAIISWKGRLKPKKVNEAINVADVYPTLAFLVGIEIPKETNIEGVNFWSFLEGEPQPRNRIMYWRMKHGFALKKGGWKLIHLGETLEEGIDELYNTSLDPNETNNLASENESILLELKKEMEYQFSLDSSIMAKEIQ